MKRKRQKLLEDNTKHSVSTSKTEEQTKKVHKKARFVSRDLSRSPHNYSESQRNLLVGEGDFSFARALLRLFDGNGSNITATSYDTLETAIAKYDDTQQDPISCTLAELEVSGATVKFGVDATCLHKSFKAVRTRGKKGKDRPVFDRITFNFPHVGLGIKDQDVNVEKNRSMLAAFFKSACSVLHPLGEVHLALKEGKPYSLWNVTGTAHIATDGILCLKTSFTFNPVDFPGYHHRRTSGHCDALSVPDNEEIRGRSRTYVFARSNGY